MMMYSSILDAHTYEALRKSGIQNVFLDVFWDVKCKDVESFVKKILENLEKSVEKLRELIG